MRLGERLVMMGWTTPEQVEEGLAEQERLRAEGVDEWIGQILLRHGYVDADHLAAALANHPLTDAA